MLIDDELLDVPPTSSQSSSADEYINFDLNQLEERVISLSLEKWQVDQAQERNANDEMIECDGRQYRRFQFKEEKVEGLLLIDQPVDIFSSYQFLRFDDDEEIVSDHQNGLIRI